ncbi:MAG: hypothetical protein K0R29_2227 [Pseudobdellovibrio sp.]|nr:hypothetical protein [Pseudobdellovibrio sp.]
MKIIIVAAFLFSFNAQAQVKSEMQKFYSLLERIQKYAFDKTEYFKKANEAELAEALRLFNETVSKIKSDKAGSQDDMKFRLQLLKEALEQAEAGFKKGNKDYSLWALRSSLNQCYSCHTQKSLAGTHYKISNWVTKSDYLKAEFLFVVRNYDEAVPLYESVVAKYPKTTLDEVENSIQKLVFHAVRVKKDEVATLNLIDRLSKNKELPRYIQNSFQAWKKYLEVKKYKVAEDRKFETASDISDYISDRNDLAGSYRLANQRYLLDLDTTQKLYELFGESKDVNLKPWLLYWLAYQEKDFQYTMFDNSAELYLRECIENYSKSPAAKQCLQLYKEMIRDSFTGSRGTYIPESVQKQFFQYEKIIEGK